MTRLNRMFMQVLPTTVGAKEELVGRRNVVTEEAAWISLALHPAIT